MSSKDTDVHDESDEEHDKSTVVNKGGDLFSNPGDSEEEDSDAHSDHEQDRIRDEVLKERRRAAPKVTETHFHIDEDRFPFQQSKMYLFVKDELLWTALCVLSNLVFWVYGYPLEIKFGYSNYIDEMELNTSGVGGIPSGPSGSGAVVITAFVMIYASFIWLMKYTLYDAAKMHPEIETILGFTYLWSTKKTKNTDGYQYRVLEAKEKIQIEKNLRMQEDV